MLNKVRSIAVAAGATLLVTMAGAQAQSGREIMQKVNAVSGHFVTAIAEVTLTTGKGDKQRERLLRLVSKQEEGSRYLIATFRAPEAVKGVGFSTIYDGAENSRESWVYLPSVGKVRELKGSQQHGSFFGSDFSYSDLMGRDVEQDTHELTGQDDSFFTVESTPKNKADAYSKMQYKIAKSDMTVREVTFYNKSGDVLKRLTNLSFEVVDDIPIVLNSEMENLKSGSKTLLERMSMQIGVDLYFDDFGPEALQ